MSVVILGQEAICPDGLGRVVGFCFERSGQYVQVSTYVNDRKCKWDPKNVRLVHPGNAVYAALSSAPSEEPPEGREIVLRCSSLNCSMETTLTESIQRNFKEGRCGNCGATFIIYPDQLNKIYKIMKNLRGEYGGGV